MKLLSLSLLVCNAASKTEAFLPEGPQCKASFDPLQIEELVFQKLCPDRRCLNAREELIDSQGIDDMVPIEMCRHICASMLVDKNRERIRDDFVSNDGAWLSEEEKCIEKSQMSGGSGGGGSSSIDCSAKPVEECPQGCKVEGEECVEDKGPDDANGDKKDDNKNNCAIQTYCRYDECAPLKQMCLMIVKREACKLKGKRKGSVVDMDCYIQLQTSRQRVSPLTADKVRELVNSAGIKAYNAAALREQAVCEKYGIPKEVCTFDRAFEVQSQRDLRMWFIERAKRECERLRRNSPKWMKPSLDCEKCSPESNGSQCDDNAIAARQMRIQYHQVRFAEMLLMFRGDKRSSPVGSIDWAVNYFGAQPGAECFSNFFGLQRSSDNTGRRKIQTFVAEPPADICLDALADEMKLMLSVDQGQWYLKHAKKLFTTFFSSVETGEELIPSLDVTDKELYHILERARSNSREAFFKELHVLEGDARAAPNGKLIKRSKLDLISYDFEGKKWTVNIILKLLKAMLRAHDQTLPFILQNEEVRHMLWINLVFLQRAVKAGDEAPSYGNITTVLRKMKSALETFKEHIASQQKGEEIDANLCGIAFYGIMNGGADIKYAARIAATVPRAEDALKEFFKNETKDKEDIFAKCLASIKKETGEKEDAQADLNNVDTNNGMTLQDMGKSASLDEPVKTEDKKDDKNKELEHALGKQKTQYKELKTEMENCQKLLEKLRAKAGADAAAGGADREPTDMQISSLLENNIAPAKGSEFRSMTLLADDIVQLQLGNVITDLLASLVQDYQHSKQRVHLLRTTLSNVWNTHDEAVYTDMLDIKFRWYSFLSQPELWPEVVSQEVNDGGLVYRKKEMEMLQTLCRIFRIDPYSSYTPPDARRLKQKAAFQDLVEENFDKQQCSLQHVLARQYALRGREQYKVNTGAHPSLEEGAEGAHNLAESQAKSIYEQFKFPDEAKKEGELEDEHAAEEEAHAAEEEHAAEQHAEEEHAEQEKPEGEGEHAAEEDAEKKEEEGAPATAASLIARDSAPFVSLSDADERHLQREEHLQKEKASGHAEQGGAARLSVALLALVGSLLL